MHIGGLIKRDKPIEYTQGAFSKEMFYYIQGRGHFICNKDYFTNRKDYNSILLLYTIKGSGILKYRKNLYTLCENQVFIIDCMEKQYYATNDDIWEFNFIHFNGSSSRKYFKKIMEIGGPVLNLKDDSIIPFNLNKIGKLTTRDIKVDIITSCLIVEILTELLMLSYNFIMKEDSTTGYIKRVLDIIENEYSNKITLEYIAKDININKFYLTRLFKKHTSESLYEYIVNYRINKAKELLRTTKIPICEVAVNVGFDSVSNFIKTFKKFEEITPRKFRNLWN